jgi:two-component system LytT family sensor kinase
MAKELNIKKYIEPAIHIFIWGSLFALIISQTRTLGEFRKANGTIYYPIIFGTITSVILFYFNALYLIPHFISKNKYITYIFVTLAFYLGLSMFDSLIDHFCFIAYYSSEKEPFFVEASMNYMNNLYILSLSLGYGYTKNWIRNEKARRQLIEDKLNAELKFLKAQINPHFLFNTLNMAYSSAIKSSDTITANIIEKLAVLMRYVLYESNGDKVSLVNEINYVENYICLQLQRLSPEISDNIKYQIKGNWEGYKIAPMILAPFIENVFKNGVRLNKESGIEINLKLLSNVLTLETRNALNINKDSTNDSNLGIGLNNVRRRLQIIYPNRHKLEIETSNDIYHSTLEVIL